MNFVEIDAREADYMLAKGVAAVYLGLILFYVISGKR